MFGKKALKMSKEIFDYFDPHVMRMIVWDACRNNGRDGNSQLAKKIEQEFSRQSGAELPQRTFSSEDNAKKVEKLSNKKAQ